MIDRIDERHTGIRILLLEDSDIDAELLVGHLQSAGLEFTLVRAIDKASYLQALGTPQIDVILSDYSLPSFDGMAALELALQYRRDVPFIFVSGVLGEHFATESLKRGATDYIVKRNLTRLPTAVRRALAESKERASRRRAEDALQASELNMRLAVNVAELGLWDYDPPTGRLTWDRRCRQLFGIEHDHAIDHATFIAGCHPDDRERMDLAISRAIDPVGGGDIHEEYRILAPDGRIRWVMTRGQALFEDGACVRFVGVLQDVTEQKETEAQLRRLNETLEARVEERTRERDRIWRVSRDLLGVAHPNGVFVSVNPAWERVLGWRREELTRWRFLTLIHSDDRDHTMHELASLNEAHSSVSFDNRVERRDGTWRWLSWTAVYEEGLIYCVARDITQERRAAEEIAATNRQLLDEIRGREQAEDTLRQLQRLEAVGQLTSGVAHDFNNLLTVILGNLAFIERDFETADPRMQRRLTLMRAAGERGAKLTSQLLAFSRRQRLVPETVNLNDTVLGMRDLLASTMGGSIRVEIDLEPQLWSTLVDPTQIELVILNLAINSRDAMEVGGTLRLTTANLSPKDGGHGQDRVAIRVADTGSGMPDHVLEKVFEPFFTTKEVGKGSGLGLAQVYGIVKQSGGDVTIDTKVGEGTTFTVLLPRTRSNTEPADDTNEAPTLRVPRDLRAWHILIADDDAAVREVTTTILREAGFRVSEAGSGGAALALLDAHDDIDLLIVDYAMPGMNGAELAQLAHARRPDLPFVFVTGYADLSALDGIAQDRAIQKPFRGEDLLAGVRRVLEDVPARAATRGVPRAGLPGGLTSTTRG